MRKKYREVDIIPEEIMASNRESAMELDRKNRTIFFEIQKVKMMKVHYLHFIQIFSKGDSSD